ncbi:MAG: NADP(H)-dependent aldo-keto reductase [Rhodospirillales bacterium]|nr:NADP(H)-dependent aldo-keto reductase [Rhodospirillales bacterium]
MQYRRLGRTGIEVSLLCLGTMNFGSSETEAEGFRQMDFCLDRGINFLDTAEMYSIPVTPKHQGNSERVIGNWMKARGSRDKVIVSTKVAGPDERLDFIRDGNLRLDRRNIEQAIDDSLARLQTDYVDLYQLHWPDRDTNTFGQLGYTHPTESHPIPLEETLAVLGDLVTAGKVRTIGVSNETPWGTMRLLHLAETLGLPRIVTNQNPYNLLNRTFEAGCAEIAMREHVGLLAYAPMAAGALSGKYLDGARPEGARMTMYPTNRRYLGPPNAEPATRAYVELARDHGLDPGLMALAFVAMQPFMTSSIIGASSMAQLEKDVDCVDLALSDDLLTAIEDIHTRYTYPCP